MKKFLLASTYITRSISAFENKSGWKLDADGKIVVSNGHPVYVKEDGSEATIDGGTISRLNGEAKSHRERAEAAEAKAKAFDGLDPVVAKEAIEKLSKIDQKKLIDAGEIDKVRDEIGKGYQSQIAERDGKISTTQAKLDKLMLDNAFNSSEFVRERVAIPPEMFRAFFSSNFKIEDEKIIAYDATGNKIFSKTRMGEIATPDEALEILVERYPQKDAILKAVNHSGSGNGGGGGGRGGMRSMKRADFDKLDPGKKAEASGLMGKGELTITD